ncbi:MAG: MBL fold metallo-hydrolase [bacterium]
MEIQFLGATKTVTGSKYLLKTSDKKVLIDCGLFQGLKDLRLRNRYPLPIAPETIDAVILTHAHLDHTGYLPLLVKNGFRGKIYCTQITKEMCKILLLDSGHLQEEDAARANRHGYSKHKPALPLYTRADAEAVFPQLTATPFHQDFSIGDLVFRYNHAGHILGAACLIAKQHDTSILFSGDLGRMNDPCVISPENIFAANYLVIESTYGDRLHEKIDPKEQLGEIIKRTVRRGGTVIIPAFAVGRTQSILYYIYQLKQEGKIPNIPVFLDSPMAQDMTEIMLRHKEEHRLSENICTAVTHMARYINTVEESKQLDNYPFPKIIISASGMLTGGRVLHHIKALANDKRNVIVLSGYQAAGTRGDALLHGRNVIKIYGELVTVNSEVVALSNISAHADYQEMIDWLKNITTPPRKVFITHGDPAAAESLQKKITDTLHWSCEIPDYLQKELLCQN